MGQRIEKVYSGALTKTLILDHATSSSKKLVKGIFVYADGVVSVEIKKNYETIFQLTDNITPAKIVQAKKKMYSIERPARGNTYTFTLAPGATNPSATISVFVVTE